MISQKFLALLDQSTQISITYGIQTTKQLCRLLQFWDLQQWQYQPLYTVLPVASLNVA